MINIKTIAVSADGNIKRIGITYDEIDAKGTMVRNNVRISKVVVNDDALRHISMLEDYAMTLISEE